MHIEREIKLRMPAGAARRLWRLVRTAGLARRRNVSSIYYDTSSERLRRSGVALRLRRDGKHWLQTLKLESAPAAGFAARAEWEVPAPRGRLDLGAFPRAEIMAATGLDLLRLEGKLKPLFETRFVRRSAPVAIDGATRAEICVDQGHVVAGEKREAISEIEVELQAGDPAALLGYASTLAKALTLELEFESKAERGYRLAAGEMFPRPRKWRRPTLGELATPSEAFSAIFTAGLAQAGANARGVVHGHDAEYLHQMRVGLRRLRSALRAFRALVPKAAAKPLVKRLRGLMPGLGAARDWDVFCEGLVRVGMQAPDRASAMAALLARARGKRSAARRHARQAAASPKLQAFLLRALRWVNDAPWEKRAATAEGSLARFAVQALDGLHARALKQAHGIDWGDAERRHRLRIRMKRLRYACDFFAPSFPGASARPYVKRLGALQDILGDLNDIAVARRLVGEIRVRRAKSRAAKLAPRGSDRAIAAAATYVRQTLAERERNLVASLEPAWASFEKRRPFWRGAR